MLFFCLLKFLGYVVLCLLSVAFLTLLERKVLGLIGYRLGPAKVLIGGVLQPFADAMKLMNKEISILSSFSPFLYYMSSILMFCSMSFILCLLCGSPSSSDYNFSLCFVLLVLALNSFKGIISGWSTYTKYSLMGSLRSVCQLISYEILFILCLFFLFVIYMGLSISSILEEQVNFFLLVPSVLFFWIVSVLAELNRAPYDFSEGESELVSGFNVEFGSVCFTLLFLSEYGNIMFFMVLTNLIFLGKLSLFFIFLFFWVIWVRSMVPRYRFDKLTMLSWKVLIPHLGFLFLLYYSMVSSL